jgi:hypothetical protein
MSSDAITCELSPYELQRKERILENERFLKSLEITDIVNEIKTSTATKKRRKRKIINIEEQRKSSRIDKTSATTVELSLSSNCNVFCKFKPISIPDLKQSIQDYSKKHICHRVSTFLSSMIHNILFFFNFRQLPGVFKL